MLERLAAGRPVVVVLDDLHWADGATVGLLRVVARKATTLPVVVVGTYRDTDLDRRHPLAEALPLLRREVEPTRLALAGLPTEAVHDLLERLADHDVPETFAALLAQQTDGNPFFLREMLIHLADIGALRFEDGVWVAAEDIAAVIPEGVREVVGRRLSLLSEESQRLLGVGALFEVAFPLAVAAEVAGLDEETALDAVDEVLAAQVVTATESFDHYAFSHALFRQTLVAELNPSRQVRAHRTIAEALDKRIGVAPTAAEAAVLARHWHLSAALPGAERGARGPGGGGRRRGPLRTPRGLRRPDPGDRTPTRGRRAGGGAAPGAGGGRHPGRRRPGRGGRGHRGHGRGRRRAAGSGRGGGSRRRPRGERADRG